MIKHKGVLILLCTLVLMLASAGAAQAAPAIILIGDENCQVTQYRIDDAMANQVMLDDMLSKMGSAFENGNSLVGVTGDNLLVDLNSGLENVSGYIYYENGVTAGTIAEGTYLPPDFFAEIDEDGLLVFSKPSQGEAQKDVGQWIGSGYHVLNNGFIDAVKVAKKNAVNKSFLQNYLNNSIETKMDSETHTSQKAIEIFQSINTSTEASYSDAFFSGSVSVDYSKASTTKRNETLIKHFAILRQSVVKYDPPDNDDLNNHRDAVFIAALNTGVGNLINSHASQTSINNAVKDIFTDYGTHIILGYELGGRAELNYSFSNQACIEKSDIETAVKASYKGIDKSVSGENRTKITKNIEQVNTYSDLKIHFSGGQLNDMTSIGDFNRNYNTWTATVKAAPTMLSIPSIDNDMIPLWELTGEPRDYSDATNTHGYGPIALAMYNCFNDMAMGKEDILKQYDYSATSNREDYVITDIGVWGNNTKQSALDQISTNGYEVVRLQPEGHNRYELEANNGAGGSYIYIAYRMERFRENNVIKQDVLARAIVDIAVTVGKNKRIPNYTHLGVDLNADVGGDYIYLNYLTKANDSQNKFKPLEEISGYYTKLFNLPYGWRNPSESHDLNRGVHGSTDIYLVVKPKTNI